MSRLHAIPSAICAGLKWCGGENDSDPEENGSSKIRLELGLAQLRSFSAFVDGLKA